MEQIKGKHHISCKLLSVVLSLGLLVSVILPVMAEETINEVDNQLPEVQEEINTEIETTPIVETTPVVSEPTDLETIEPVETPTVTVEDELDENKVVETAEPVVTPNVERVVSEATEGTPSKLARSATNPNQDDVSVTFVVDSSKGNVSGTLKFDGKKNNGFNTVVTTVPTVSNIENSNFEFEGWSYNGQLYTTNDELKSQLVNTNLTSSISIVAQFKEINQLDTKLIFVIHPSVNSHVTVTAGQLEFTVKVKENESVSLTNIVGTNSLPQFQIDPNSGYHLRGYRVYGGQRLVDEAGLLDFLNKTTIKAGSTTTIKVGIYKDTDTGVVTFTAGENGYLKESTDPIVHSMFIGTNEAQNVSTIIQKYPTPVPNANYEFDYWAVEDLSKTFSKTYANDANGRNLIGQLTVGQGGGYNIKAVFKKINYEVKLNFNIQGNGFLNQQEQIIPYSKTQSCGIGVSLKEVMGNNIVPTPSAKNGNEFVGWTTTGVKNVMTSTELENWLSNQIANDDMTYEVTALFKEIVVVNQGNNVPTTPVEVTPITNPETINNIVTPVVVNQGEQIETDEVIINDEETPEVQSNEKSNAIIEDEETPLSMSHSTWSLVDMILMILTLCLGLACMIEKENKKMGVKILSILAILSSIVIFFITQDLQGTMIFVNKWTISMGIITLVQVVIFYLVKKNQKIVTE